MNKPERMAFINARLRCCSPSCRDYPNYGGRGIQFRFETFEQFMACLGPRPTGHMLDRIDNNGHYEPGNVRWTTRKEQNLKRRRTNKWQRHHNNRIRDKNGRYAKIPSN